MRRRDFVFTSESVSEGHPDKLCDQISDAVLDAYLEKDPTSRVACETLATTGRIVIAGEVASQAKIEKSDIEAIARSIARQIGYTSEEIGLNADTAHVEVLLHEQSPDIAQGVTGQGLFKEEGAGDQGMMFGYAVRDTQMLMPAPIYYAHKLLENLSALRKSGKIPFLRPDAKSQVSVRYSEGRPKAIETVVISTQHSEDVSYETVREAVIEECIKKTIPQELLQSTRYLINPTGRFVVGGPHGDCGLTGRKIIVDTYGGFARHGGGAFSGKDPSKVDRSAAYMARYVAKNIVAAGLAEECEIQVSYAIGVAKPVSVLVETFGTGKVSEEKLEKRVQEIFDLSPKGIREILRLREMKYLPTAVYGHFGREGQNSFSWEKTDRVAELL
ncbi:MAG: methionine adenosyltransferase [Leptospiraceae bacterium]|nr:methionine adenosyltransferase [Leptospiraceae bacterium]MDW8306426.1 methionine adenosyltransferase [Leptospiraceae bacterium]